MFWVKEMKFLGGKMKFVNTYEKKKKKTQYIIASVISIIILSMWLTIPLMNKSSWDSTVSNPYGMSKKSADLSLMDSAGFDAPGQPLTGALIDNPATTLDLEASSLFKMPDSDIKYEEESSQDEDSIQNTKYTQTAHPNVGGIGVSNPPSKLNKLPSLSGGNANTMTVGTTHNRFFGQNTAKAELIPAMQENSKDIKSTKRNFALEALKSAEKNSVASINAKSADAARTGALNAFEKSQKVDELYLSGKDEKDFKVSGLEIAKAETELKRNDPSVSKKKISIPQPKKDEDESKKMEEQIKQMLLQAIIQGIVGQVFGAIGQVMAMQMCPECYKKGSSN